MALTQQSGFSLPLVQAGPKGRLRYTSQDTVSLINYSIHQILMTLPGERFWNPTFGSLLRKMNFENTSQTTITTIKNIIIDSLTQWEPRISVTAKDITVTPTVKTDTALTTNVKVQIQYTVTNPDFTTSRQPTSVTVFV